MHFNRSKKPVAAYTLVELLVSACILMMGATAAFHMAANAVKIEELNTRLSRGLNLQENYARLWQLGVSTTDITGKLLPRSTEVAFTPVSTPPSLPAVGTLEGLTLTANLDSGMAKDNAGIPITRPNTLSFYRSTR